MGKGLIFSVVCGLLIPQASLANRGVASSDAVAESMVMSVAQKESGINKKISGVVLDKDGEPLPGATIMIEGTTVATVSDIDGKFSLNVNSENPVL